MALFLKFVVLLFIELRLFELVIPLRLLEIPLVPLLAYNPPLRLALYAKVLLLYMLP